MEAIGINLGYLIVHTFNFLMMLVILSALAYRPILNALTTRRQKIAQGLEDARVAAEARANAEKEAAKIMADAQAKAGQVMREATERAEAAARDIRSEAEAAAAKERELAVAEVQQERERILGDLRGQVAALSLAVAQKLIGETLDDRRQRQLIDEFFSGVRDGRVEVMEGAALDRGAAEITSALPLTDQEKETIRQEILSKGGERGVVTFRVDPSILGGLVIRVGDKVWDASISGQLSNLRESLV